MKDGKAHYITITHMSRLLSKQSGVSENSKRHYCPYCLHPFYRKHARDTHIQDCMVHGNQRVEYPTQDKSILEFKDYAKCLTIPYVFIADFESVLKPVRDTSKGSTKKLKKHIAPAFSFRCISSIKDESFPQVSYRGKHAGRKFVTMLLDREQRMIDLTKRFKTMKLSDDEKEQFAKAEVCHICGRPFTTTTDDQTIKENQRKIGMMTRVRDHCHLTGISSALL
jgi:hypothetical protein